MTIPHVMQNLLQQAITDVMGAAAERFDKHETQVPHTNEQLNARLLAAHTSFSRELIYLRQIAICILARVNSRSLPWPAIIRKVCATLLARAPKFTLDPLRWQSPTSHGTCMAVTRKSVRAGFDSSTSSSTSTVPAIWHL